MGNKSNFDKIYEIGQKILKLQDRIVQLQNKLSSIVGEEPADNAARKVIAEKILELKRQIKELIFQRNAVGAKPGSNAASGGKKPTGSNKKKKARFACHVDKWSQRPESSKGLGSPTKVLPKTGGKLKPGILILGIHGAGAGGRALVNWARHIFVAPHVKKGLPGIVPIPGAAAGGAGVSGAGGGIKRIIAKP